MIDLFNFGGLLMEVSYECGQSQSLIDYLQIRRAIDVYNLYYPKKKIGMMTFFNMDIDCTWMVVKRYKDYGIITTRSHKYLDQLNLLQSLGFDVKPALTVNDPELIAFLKSEKISPKEFRIIEEPNFNSPHINELLNILIANIKIPLSLMKNNDLMSIKDKKSKKTIYEPKPSTIHQHLLLDKIFKGEEIHLDEIFKDPTNVKSYEKHINTKIGFHLSSVFPNSYGKLPNKHFEKYFFNFTQGKCILPPGIIFEKEFIK